MDQDHAMNASQVAGAGDKPEPFTPAEMEGDLRKAVADRLGDPLKILNEKEQYPISADQVIKGIMQAGLRPAEAERVIAFLQNSELGQQMKPSKFRQVLTELTRLTVIREAIRERNEWGFNAEDFQFPILSENGVSVPKAPPGME